MTKTTQKDVIPQFKSRAELAEWFDTHDMADYWDQLEPANIIFDLEPTHEENMVIRMQSSLKKRIEQAARRKGLKASTLARMWIIEKLQAAA